MNLGQWAEKETVPNEGSHEERCVQSLGANGAGTSSWAGREGMTRRQREELSGSDAMAATRRQREELSGGGAS